MMSPGSSGVILRRQPRSTAGTPNSSHSGPSCRVSNHRTEHCPGGGIVPRKLSELAGRDVVTSLTAEDSGRQLTVVGRPDPVTAESARIRYADDRIPICDCGCAHRRGGGGGGAGSRAGAGSGVGDRGVISRCGKLVHVRRPWPTDVAGLRWGRGEIQDRHLREGYGDCDRRRPRIPRAVAVGRRRTAALLDRRSRRAWRPG